MENKKEKTGGRVKGTENKLTKDARKLFLETLEDESMHIREAFENVRNTETSLKYLEIYNKYAQFFMPKMTENNIISAEPVTPFVLADVIGFCETSE